MTRIYGWISRTDAQAAAIAAGILAGAVTAIIVLFRQPVIARPLRWVGRKLAIIGRVLVLDPIAKTVRNVLDQWADDHIHPRIDAIESTVQEIRQQVADNNGGSTLRDRVDAGVQAAGGPPPIVSE